MASYFCEKCKKTMDEVQFYTYKNGQKVEICKKCMTMHVDSFDESTFLWLLEKMDVPYVPYEWNTLRDKAYLKNPSKVNGMSVFGKYLAKMRLRQWKNKGWADTEECQKEALEKIKDTQKEQEQKDIEYTGKFQRGEISASEYRTLVSVESQRELQSKMATPIMPDITYNPFQNLTVNTEEFVEDYTEDLTREDKIYLATKWGALYTPSEWITLEKDYNNMMESFDIQDADTLNTLILICKTNLKMNQAIDNNDAEGFQKYSKVSDSLRKSAKFTALQNKEEKNDFIDSVGELVAMCEKEGFIPRFATDIPQDKVDFTLKDMNDYIHTLVTKDLGFGQQIEDSLKKIQVQKEISEAEQNEGKEFELEDEDYEAFYEEIERQKQLDAEQKGEKR